MKKKGFTLVELLGVLVVLSIILVVTIPVIINTLKNTDTNKQKDHEKNILSSAELYIEKKRSAFPSLDGDNGYAVLKVGDLINAGYLKKAEYVDESDNYIGICKKQDQTLDFIYPYEGKLCGDDVVLVNLDPNGGYLDYKQLVYKQGSTYGTLPTPEIKRSNHTFVGWHGKNMATINWRQGDWNNTTNMRRVSTNHRIYVPKGNTITISYANNTSYKWSALIFDSAAGTTYSRSIPFSEATNPYTYTAEEGSYIVFVWANTADINGTNTNITPSELANVQFQIEKGSTATRYETAFITSTTPLLQNTTHTLTASWTRDFPFLDQ